ILRCCRPSATGGPLFHRTLVLRPELDRLPDPCDRTVRTERLRQARAARSVEALTSARHASLAEMLRRLRRSNSPAAAVAQFAITGAIAVLLLGFVAVTLLRHTGTTEA